MKLLQPIALLLMLAPLASATEIRDIRGDYVEARTATVFAGACHYGSEFTTLGREALLVWRLTGGEVDGTSLAGLTIGAVVTADRNLDLQEAERRSVVYLPEGIAPERRAAAETWLRETRAAAIGEVVAVRTVPMVAKFEGDAYDVRIGERIRLSGGLLPNRDCCSQRHRVWYRPFDREVRRPVVGEAERFECAEKALGRRWSTRFVNCVFAGRVGPEPAEVARAGR